MELGNKGRVQEVRNQGAYSKLAGEETSEALATEGPSVADNHPAEEPKKNTEAEAEEREIDAQVSASTDSFLRLRQAQQEHDVNVAIHLRPIAMELACQELEDPSLQLTNSVRVEAFLMSVALALPRDPVNVPSELLRWRKRVGSFSDEAMKEHPQLERTELWLRLKAYIKALKLLRTRGSDEEVDKVRISLVLRSYQASAARLARLLRPSRLLLPPLLYTLACEILVIRLPSPEVREKVDGLVSQYEKNAKLWMYHPGSQNAEKYLRPLVEDFVSWIRANRAQILHSSATEGLLRSIDPDLRYKLKHQVYRSPNHFLKVFRSVSSKLSWISLPPYAIGDAEVDGSLAQAVRDISREMLCINGTLVEGNECTSVLRAEIEGLLKRTKTLKRVHSDISWNLKNEELEDKEHVRRSESLIVGSSPKPISSLGNKVENIQLSTFFDLVFEEKMQKQQNAEALEEKQNAGEISQEDEGNCEQPESDVETDKLIHHMLWRVLNATSRTRAGGDSFFVTQDLFGGDGVLLKPSEAPLEPITIDLEQEFMVIKFCSSYDIYDEEDVVTATDEVAPLMTIQALMTEILPPPALNPTSVLCVTGRRSGRYLTLKAVLPSVYCNSANRSLQNQDKNSLPNTHYAQIFDDLDFL